MAGKSERNRNIISNHSLSINNKFKNCVSNGQVHFSPKMACFSRSSWDEVNEANSTGCIVLVKKNMY